MRWTQRWSSHVPRWLGVSSAALAGAMLVAVPLWAQQQDEGQQQEQQSQQQQQQQGQQQSAEQEQTAQEQAGQGQSEREQFAQRFWEFLQKSDYRENWSRWPGHEGFTEGRQGQDPHGDSLKIYVNPKAESSLENPVAESVIVKENYNDEKELVSITPMYRVDADYDPPNRNWYWAMYRPDGSLFEADDKKLAGKVESCIECHVAADGQDYVFNNDPEE